MVSEAERGMRLGKYDIGRTLGEGNFGKVKLARHVDTGRHYAVKILDRKKVASAKCHDQIKREIGTLKLLKHPNVVRLHEAIIGMHLFSMRDKNRLIFEIKENISIR